ncbi:hypothetical protein BHE74_00021978 [Ensete ventricosum]|nr:hypothetical protein BHE74_00021978 [Ensete ventricosum]
MMKTVMYRSEGVCNCRRVNREVARRQRHDGRWRRTEMADGKRVQASRLISVEDTAATRFLRTVVRELVAGEEVDELRTRLLLLKVNEINDSSNKRGVEKEEGFAIAMRLDAKGEAMGSGPWQTLRDKRCTQVQ